MDWNLRNFRFSVGRFSVIVVRRKMETHDEREIFRVLYDEHSRPVGVLLFSMLADPLDAEDLCYEVFLHLWEKCGDPATRREVLRVVLRLLRRQRRRAAGARYAPLATPEPAATGTPAARLRRAWDRLPRPERLAILLDGFAGVPAPVAAVLLRTGDAALRKRVVRGVLRLGAKERDCAPAHFPSLCRAGEKKLLHHEWESHAAGCPVCSSAASVAGRGIRAAKRITKSAFPARVRRRLLRRLLRDLPSLTGTLYHDSVETPIGTVRIAMLGGAVVGIGISGGTEEQWLSRLIPRLALRAARDPKRLRPAVRQVKEYFAGRRRIFSFPYRLLGVSPFQAEVLAACSEVPYGSVSSYGDLAEKVGRPRATRAVGGALGANPLPLVIPCHRILSSRGGLQGFSGGLEMKEKLLALEGRGGLFAPFPAT